MWKEIISLAIVVGVTMITYYSGYSVGLREGIKTGRDKSFKQVTKEALDFQSERLTTMTQEELKEMERFAAILSSRLEEVTDEYDDVDNLLRLLEDDPIMNIYNVVEEIRGEYEDLRDKLTDLSEAVDEFTKAIGRIKEESAL